MWFSRIMSSDDQNCKANVKWFVESHRAGLFTLSSQEDIVPWRSILGYARMRRMKINR